MTRETKIGLLVGLAFIIVIGILLSEHVSSTSEPQQAAFGGAGANVRDGVMTPAGSDSDSSPVTVIGGANAPADAPRHAVPTRDDLRAVTPPVTVARAGRGSNGTAGISPAPPAAAGISDGSAVNDAPFSPGTSTPPSADGASPRAPAAPLVANPVDPPAARLPRGTRELLLQHPEDLTPVDGSPAANRPSPATPGGQYVAVAGDSLSHMAARLMGANSKANRELLIRANPSLQADGNPVIAGRTYTIPNAAFKASKGSVAGGTTALTGSETADAARAARADGFQWYTVKGNDNLWKIAEGQLGNGNAWTQIRDMNKDVLKGGETVHPNMRLRLPAKAAVANVN